LQKKQTQANSFQLKLVREICPPGMTLRFNPKTKLDF